MDKVALGQVSPPVFLFSPFSNIASVFILVCIYMLLLAEGEAREGWEPYEKQCSCVEHWTGECLNVSCKGLKDVLAIK